jgi:hypothetical protein
VKFTPEIDPLHLRREAQRSGFRNKPLLGGY